MFCALPSKYIYIHVNLTYILSLHGTLISKTQAKDCSITLLDSIMSGRKQIFVNGEKIFDLKIPKNQKEWGHIIVEGNFRLEVRLNGDNDDTANQPR